MNKTIDGEEYIAGTAAAARYIGAPQHRLANYRANGELKPIQDPNGQGLLFKKSELDTVRPVEQAWQAKIREIEAKTWSKFAPAMQVALDEYTEPFVAKERERCLRLAREGCDKIYDVAMHPGMKMHIEEMLAAIESGRETLEEES